MPMSSRKPAAAPPAAPSPRPPDCPAQHELGLCTSAFGHRLSLTGEKLASLARMGLPWAEIGGLQEQHVNAFDCERIEELAQIVGRAYLPDSRHRRRVNVGQVCPTYRLKIWSYHAAFVGLAMDDADTRRDAVRKTLQAARAARRLGAGIVVVHPGRDVPIVNRRREIGWTIEGLSAIAEKLPRGMKAALETMGSAYLCGPADEMLRVMDAGDLRGAPVGVCFDSGHVNIGSDPTEYARALAGRIVTVHLHDNRGDQDAHALPGEGNIDWPPLLRALHEGGYAGPWMCEAGPDGKSLRAFVKEYARRMKEYCR